MPGRHWLVLPVLAACLPAAPLPYFSVLSDDAGAWPQILSTIGLQRRPAGVSHVFVARAGASASAEWPARVERGSILILEGESSLADLFGFRRNASVDPVKVQSLTDVHRPTLPIVWEHGLELPVFEIPDAAQVFARERWSGTPMSAGFRRGQGAVLWIATTPGERGYERFPYLLNALADLGLDPPFRSNRLWAFFDSAYRTRVDLDYLAARWRRAGIAALQVAAWHNFEPDPEADAFLAKLIETCHREGILVYAWFELPHVSERFWAAHPEWREKTATGQDAQLDWRKLMNLNHPDCFRAVSAGVRELLGRFDWDGVNLAELYFESLEGVSNPSRFTPYSPDFSSRAALDRRADLVFKMQQDWLNEVEQVRRAKPHLEIVLTHIDDRFDSSIRDSLGADAARVLPLLDTHNFTFLIEDPATIWHLGPQRYPAIAERYRPLTDHSNRLAIDINVADRYQDVYPTKQQTGTELFQLVHQAAASFPRVALYFENSLLPPDLKLLPSAAANVTRIETLGPKLVVESMAGVGVPWKDAAKVDGVPWPVRDDETLWLPAGAHTVETAPPAAGPRLLHLTADLKSARIVDAATVEFTYQSQSRAIALLDRKARRVQIDGEDAPLSLLLPRGQHVVSVTVE
ncbi:MAG TPA: hypothetical protein VMH28_14080 [Candidatus Acidoferrales bacterium]|nr:hypothetical protein [Candidatus Acidoferrales bacterium]